MRIYLDVLMITNGIISLIFINCISKITHTKVTNLRMLLSCFIGGASSLLMIINTSSFLKSLGVTSIKFIAVIIINGSHFLFFLPFKNAAMSITNRSKYTAARYIVKPIPILLCKPQSV